MRYKWDDVKKIFGVKPIPHFMERCRSRHISPTQIAHTLRYGKVMWYFDGSELVTRYLDINTSSGVIVRRNRLITAINFYNNRKRMKRFLKNQDTFVFETI